MAEKQEWLSLTGIAKPYRMDSAYSIEFRIHKYLDGRVPELQERFGGVEEALDYIEGYEISRARRYWHSDGCRGLGKGTKVNEAVLFHVLTPEDIERRNRLEKMHGELAGKQRPEGWLASSDLANYTKDGSKISAAFISKLQGIYIEAFIESEGVSREVATILTEEEFIVFAKNGSNLPVWSLNPKHYKEFGFELCERPNPIYPFLPDEDMISTIEERRERGVLVADENWIPTYKLAQKFSGTYSDIVHGWERLGHGGVDNIGRASYGQVVRELQTEGFRAGRIEEMIDVETGHLALHFRKDLVKDLEDKGILREGSNSKMFSKA